MDFIHILFFRRFTVFFGFFSPDNQSNNSTPTKNSMVFASDTMDANKSNSLWVFHPIYSLRHKNDGIPLSSKILQIYFTLSTLFFFLGVFSGAKIGLWGIIISFIITWALNYIFGYLLKLLINSKKTYSFCGKMVFLALFYMGFVVIILLVYSRGRGVIEDIVTFVVAYVVDSIICDSLVVCMVSCLPWTSKWFKIRGFAE